MPAKTCHLLLGIMLLIATGSYAQTDGSYKVYDSSVLSPKWMPQQTEFWNDNPRHSFPAKPRNRWEIGLSPGSIAVSGDIPARMPGPGFELHIRQAIGYVFQSGCSM